MFRFQKPAMIAAALLALTSVQAQAHPKLLSSTPAANATVAKPGAIQLVFNEKLVAQFSGADIVMTGMPGMKDHPPMKINGVTSKVSADGKTLVATPAKPLAAGTYKVDWHVVTADTHRVTGSIAFTVR